MIAKYYRQTGCGSELRVRKQQTCKKSVSAHRNWFLQRAALGEKYPYETFLCQVALLQIDFIAASAMSISEYQKVGGFVTESTKHVFEPPTNKL